MSEIRLSANLATILKQIELDNAAAESLQACGQCKGSDDCQILAQAQASIKR